MTGAGSDVSPSHQAPFAPISGELIAPLSVDHRNDYPLKKTMN